MNKIVVFYAICLFSGCLTQEPAPGCQFATFWINCYYINADNVQQVQEYLTLASQLFRHYSLAFYYSNITVLPEDLLAGYILDDILFQENEDVYQIPLLLNNANSNLQSVSFSGEHITMLTKEQLVLPFSSSLQHLFFIDCPLQNIEVGTFANYTSLRELWFEGSDLTVLEADTFQGTVSLESLVFFNGTLNDIEVDAFYEMPLLLELELDSNKLSFLDEGVFDGLPQSAGIFLFDNPFNCTCELQWLKNWLNESNQLESSGATCTFPVSAPFAEVDFCGSTSIHQAMLT